MSVMMRWECVSDRTEQSSSKSQDWGLRGPLSPSMTLCSHVSRRITKHNIPRGARNTWANNPSASFASETLELGETQVQPKHSGQHTIMSKHWPKNVVKAPCFTNFIRCLLNWNSSPPRFSVVVILAWAENSKNPSKSGQTIMSKCCGQKNLVWSAKHSGPTPHVQTLLWGNTDSKDRVWIKICSKHRILS